MSRTDEKKISCCLFTGAPALALDHYRLMNVKQVQTDTLSHLILSRAAMWSLAPLGDITYMSECMEASQIYMSNSTEVCNLLLILFAIVMTNIQTAEFIARAFSTERYSQVKIPSMVNSCCGLIML